MCKFCEMKDGNENCGEKYCINDISEIKDGTHRIGLFMNRYIVERDKIHKSELNLDYDISFDNNARYNLKHKVIKIKYCPFCGEKL